MKNAIDLIKRYEGVSLSAYQCPAGVWTIGWGHTRGVRPGQVISGDTANNLLQKDVKSIFEKLDAMCADAGITLSGNQRSALVSFIFNVGIGAFRRSTLWRLIRLNPYDPAISPEFARWKYADGKAMPGLIRRRREEAALYFK